MSQLENFKDSLFSAVRFYWSNINEDLYDTHQLNDILSNEDYKLNRQLIMLYYKKRKLRIPELFDKNRDLIDFLNYLVEEVELESEAYKEIKEELYPIIDTLEMSNIELEIIYVKPELPEILTHSYILAEIKKGEKRIEQGDFSGAITSSKTLVESVIKELLIVFEPNNEFKIDGYDLPKLFKCLKKHLNMNNVETKNDITSQKESFKTKYADSLNNIIRGLTSITQGLAELRNLSGDSHLPTVKASSHHAVLAVNSSITICNFLFHTYKYQQDTKYKINNK